MTEDKQKRVATLYAWARDQLDAGNWPGAINTLEKLLELEPSHKEAPELLARARVEQERADRLARLYELAQERMQVGDWKRAINVCEEITTADPHYRDVCTLMEQAQQAQKKLSEVADRYRSGVLSFETGEWPTAIEMFKRVADADPQYRDVLEKLEMAQAELTRQTRLHERYQAGLKHMQRKQWAEAVAVLDEVVAEDETFAEGEAEEHLQEAREHLSREQAETVARLYDAATEYTRRGEWALAVEALEQVVDYDPEYPDAQGLLTEAREKRDDVQQAEDLYEIGVQHAQRGNWTEAAAAFAEVLELIPNFRDAERRLKSAQARAERQKRAAAPTLVGVPVPSAARPPGRTEWATIPPPPTQPRGRPVGLIGAVLVSAVVLLAVCVVLVGILAWPTVQQIALGPSGPTPTPQLSPIIITATPSPVVEGQDQVAFVQSVTVPDGTEFTPGASFPKIWRLRNVGSRTWEGYTLAFVGGEQMGAPSELPVPTTPPGETADVVASMVAPQEPGTHSGQWQMKNPAGQLFGDPLHVIIQVSGSASSPAATSPTAKPPAGTPTPEQTMWPTAAPQSTATATTEPTAAATPKPQPTKIPTTAALSGRIAFPLWNPKTGKYDVEVINADGTGQYKVMDNVRQPCWNADGSWLAVNGEIHFKEGLLIMQADGGKLRAISTQAHQARPSWSPQGNRIAFDAPVSSGNQIYVLDDIREIADPNAFRPVRYADKNVPGRYATWMPDGNLIFSSVDYYATGQKTGLFVAGADGGVMWQVTTNGLDTAPAVSASGRVAFMSRREAEGDWEIYTVSLAGDDADLKQLTDNSVHDGLPTWSPNGQYIAFVSNEGGSWGIWVMRADGGGRRKIKDLGGAGLLDDWTGERISWAP